MTVLIDPHALVVPTTCVAADELIFWERVVEAAALDKVQIGHESFYWVISQLEHLGYPEAQVDFGPPSFSRECQSAMEKILSRVSRGVRDAEDRKMTPEYLGSEEAALCISMDTTEHGGDVDALVSDVNYWAEPGDSLSLGALVIELLFDVNKETRAVAAADLRAFFGKRRIHVVGGSITNSAIKQIQSELGVSEGAIQWIASEKSKPARDIDKRWAGLDPKRDVTVCITGRVSHSVWMAADKASNKSGLQMVECASQGQIVGSLRSWAALQLRADGTN